MTRFQDQTTMTRDGQEVTFKTIPAPATAKALGAMPDLLASAKAALTEAIAAIDSAAPSADVATYLKRYYLISGTPTAQQKQMIRGVLEATMIGLKGNLTLKIGHHVSKDGDDDHGEIVRHSVRGGAKVTKPYHNKISRLDPSDKDQWVYGSMKLRAKTLVKKELGLCTLIHEATHKFAGTMDACYFANDGKSQAFFGGKMNKATALMNADSHAWFAVRCLAASKRGG